MSQQQVMLSEPHMGITDKDLERAAKVTKVINALAAGSNIKQACDRAEITPLTWRTWKKDKIVNDLIQAKYEDITIGMREVLSSSLVSHMAILCGFAKGEMPAQSGITGVLAPRDVIQAGTQVMNIWKDIGGGSNDYEREQQAIVDELTKASITINQYVVNTMNVGTESQPMPIPVGIGEVVEGEIE